MQSHKRTMKKHSLLTYLLKSIKVYYYSSPFNTICNSLKVPKYCRKKRTQSYINVESREIFHFRKGQTGNIQITPYDMKSHRTLQVQKSNVFKLDLCSKHICGCVIWVPQAQLAYGSFVKLF